MMSSVTGRVLVLGEDTRSFLSVVRSLGRSGLDVEAAWCPLGAPSLRSRYIRELRQLPAYSCRDTAWLEGLRALLRQNHYDLVIPCHDSSILPLQCHRAEIEAAGRVYLLPDDVFEVCFSKERTHELARGMRVPVPRQQVIHSRAELEDVGASWGYPLVLKPKSSVSVDNASVKQYVTKLWAAEKTGAALETYELSRGLLVEQNFIGKGVGIEVLCSGGEVLTAFQHERVHEPLLGGGSSYRKSVPLHPEMFGATQRLVAALGYTGVMMLEFKLNPVTGAWVLIEINGRFWGSLPLALAAGIDFPRYLYEMLCLGRKDFPREYRCGLFARNWVADYYWLRANLKADHTNPALMTVPPREIVLELLNLLRFRERSDTFVLDDPAPAFSEIWQVVRARLKRVAAARPEDKPRPQVTAQ